MIIRQLHPFGVEIVELTLAAASATDVTAILDFASHHRVLVFRGQTATSDSDFVGFLTRFGDLAFTEGEVPVAGATDLNVVSNVGRTTPPRSVFHTDTSYVPQPPALGALRAVVVPRAGGCTLFSNQVDAAAALPERVRDWLHGRSARHSVRGPDGVVIAVRHPLLRRHPVTGETSLFLSTPERCTDLSGCTDSESLRIIGILYRWSIRRVRLHIHHWCPGDIVLWDNRTTMHRADHSAVIGDRILHRGLVRGEVPIAASALTEASAG